MSGYISLEQMSQFVFALLMIFGPVFVAKALAQRLLAAYRARQAESARLPRGQGTGASGGDIR
jgi:hypothetical protein